MNKLQNVITIFLATFCFFAYGCDAPANVADATIPDGSTFMDGQIVEIDAGVDLGVTPDLGVDLGHDSGTVVPTCGNGSFNPPEQCDDHNTVNGDGCSSTCTVETGWKCTPGIPSTCWQTWVCPLPLANSCAGNNLGIQYVGDWFAVYSALEAANVGWNHTYGGPWQICLVETQAYDPTYVAPVVCVHTPLN